MFTLFCTLWRSGQVAPAKGHSCHRYHASLCYLPHAEKENYVKNLRCLAANISLEKRLEELTLRRNLELESHRQFVVVINLILATPVTSIAPDRTGPAVPSGPVIAVEKGFLLNGQELVLLIPCPGLCPGEDTPASPHSIKPTRKAAVTSYKPQCLIGVECGSGGRFRRWEGSSDITGQLLPA